MGKCLKFYDFLVERIPWKYGHELGKAPVEHQTYFSPRGQIVCELDNNNARLRRSQITTWVALSSIVRSYVPHPWDFHLHIHIIWCFRPSKLLTHTPTHIFSKKDDLRCGPWWQNCSAVCLFVQTNGRAVVWREDGTLTHVDFDGRRPIEWEIPRNGGRRYQTPGAKNSSLQNTHQDVMEVFRPKLTGLTNV